MPLKKKLYGKSRTIPVLNSEIEAYSWIMRGRFRKDVFFRIGKRTMPSSIVQEIAGKEKRKSSSFYAQVSRAIEELEKHGLIKCLNPKEKTGRFYELTDKGNDLKKYLEQQS